MKKFISAVLLLCLALLATSASADFVPGVYDVQADGFGGAIQVQVTLDETSIVDVNVTAHTETDGIGTRAIDALQQSIEEAENTNVDGISGATVTSDAIKAAVNAAMMQANGAAASAGVMADGVYEANAQGNNAPITVSVTIADGRFTEINVISHEETEGIYNVPFKVIPEQIVAYQSLAVDSVSGATVSSNALKSAVADCVAQAGGNVEALRAVEIPKAEKTEEVYDFDVVVVGGGLSGLTAACAAAEQGATVALIEKQAFLGGTTMLATGTIRYANEGDGAGMVQAILDEGAAFRNEGDKYPIVNFWTPLAKSPI